MGGAVKNVLAIATGLADGLNLGLNARAALITRGLTEISRLVLYWLVNNVLSITQQWYITKMMANAAEKKKG